MFKTNINDSNSDINDIINIDNENNIDTSTNKSNINDEEDQNRISGIRATIIKIIWPLMVVIVIKMRMKMKMEK